MMVGKLQEYLPQGFVDLNTAWESAGRGPPVSLIGAVVDVLPPCPTKGSSWLITFELRDPSLDDNPNVGVGFKARAFRTQPDFLPKVQKKGDIVILRQVKISIYAGSPIIGVLPSSRVIVFPTKTIPNPHFKEAFADERVLPHYSTPQGSVPTRDEQLYAIHLHHASPAADAVAEGLLRAAQQVSTEPVATRKNVSRSTEGTARVPAQASTTRSTTAQQRPRAFNDPKFALLQDVQDYKFYNVVGEVVRLFSSGYNTEIYVTDYTSNPCFYNYTSGQDEENEDLHMGRPGDQYGYSRNSRRRKTWGGPLGRMTLQVKLWPPNDTFAAQNVQEGEVYFLNNLAIKFNGGSGQLEGVLHGDRRHPSQVDIRHISLQDPRVLELVARRKTIWEPEPPKPLTKAQKKNRKKAKKEIRKQQGPAGEDAPIVKGFAASKSNLNQHVKCGHHIQGLTPLADILNTPLLTNKGPRGIEYQLPFVNMRCRAKVRVVDYDPPNLADFTQCVGYRRSRHIGGGYSYSSDEDDTLNLNDRRDGTKQWEWAFRLLVEEAASIAPGETPTKLPLIVAGDEAVGLLQLDPTDLHRSPRDLNVLKERLFILWGDLEELKSSGTLLPATKSAEDQMNGLARKPSSKPFECCIEEYGVRAEDGIQHDADPSSGWLRLHKLFGTTIHHGDVAD